MKNIPYCLRCGVDRRKGYYEGGCSAWGDWKAKHLWSNGVHSKPLTKKAEVLNLDSNRGEE